MDWPRKIIHVDMDAFFASVEQRDHPAYQGKPVIVGGDPFGRGVVSTASYEARLFGIHSAMPAHQARRLCPQAIFLRPDFKKYQAESTRIMSILRQYTKCIEPVSLDEAYLDVTENRLSIKDPVMLAGLIKQNIFAATRLTASAGVAPNLFLAKVASDLKKPNGLAVIRPDEVEGFLKDLPVRKIPGVGPVTEKALKDLGIHTCGELAAKEEGFLRAHFGKMGKSLFDMAHGVDDRTVEPHWEPRQCSTEETFPRDMRDLEFLKTKLQQFSEKIFAELKAEGKKGKTVVLKIKYFDFKQITRSKTLAAYPQNASEIFETAVQLLLEKTEAGRRPVRLIGLGISGLPTASESRKKVQEELF
jgi:DNA polymerase-4